MPTVPHLAPDTATLAALANLGPKSAQMLAAAGITHVAQLQGLGAVAAYAQVKRHDARASVNLLWALEGALTGLHWQVVAREHRTSLLLALEAHMAQSPAQQAPRGKATPKRRR
ncbi:TfoX/Sxy family protein [Rhodoferax aquaticus]|uniref:Competence protein TfoX n=1 Tax=Rhodoferax aquaticus TaxID=2527691 RepID=A0A515EUH6_9BURK|nr:TfoX/Sxy family protein [Rhodoferax aquaticus]QDL56330.1 competence protein TfoX [Rhodoferax aquaticus]